MLKAPYEDEKDKNIAEELYSILCISNGILETMCLSNRDENIVIGWILYSHEMMMEWTAFYTANYGIKGTVFSDDGAGSPFIMNLDGTITCFNAIDNESIKMAETLLDFFQL